MLGRRGLRVFDVEELSTHGGSLRIWASREEAERLARDPGASSASSVRSARPGSTSWRRTAASPGACVRCWTSCAGSCATPRRRRARGGVRRGGEGQHAAERGRATAKDIAYVVDRSPHKQGRFLPGSRIPILDPEHVRRDRPDYLLILPWNLRDEITEQMADVRDWGWRFVVPVPRLEVLP